MASYSSTRYFGIKKLSPGVLSEALRKVIGQVSRTPDDVRFSVTRDLGNSIYEDLEDVCFSGLESVCDLEMQQLASSFDDLSGRSVFLSLSGSGGCVQLYVSGDGTAPVRKLPDAIAVELGLEETPSPFDRVGMSLGGFRDVAERLQTIERLVGETLAAAKAKQRLRCFVSYRFEGGEKLAGKLGQFLHLQEVEVLGGRAYEPRRISEKVRTRLHDADFAVVIVSAARGESMWTRDEIATIAALKRPVIPLVEKGAKFEEGLFGDIEVIPFARGHIGDAFIGLLEAIKSIVRAADDESGVPST